MVPPSTAAAKRLRQGNTRALAGAAMSLAAVQCVAMWMLWGAFFGSDVPSAATPPRPAVASIDAARTSTALAPPAYGRAVVVVVDALRADAAFGPDTRLAQLASRRHQGATVDYVALAHTPTATAPRLRAMTTGGVPRFIEVAGNVFGDPNLGQGRRSSTTTAHPVATGSLGCREPTDSLVTSMAASGRRLLLLGDDTWLRMYPGAFLQRSDGTSSFFTRDTVQVDTNITRHFPRTLDAEMGHPDSRDWDVAVMHFLGLDHVGHQHGPAHPLMAAKERQMDGVLAEVAERVAAQDAVRRVAERQGGDIGGDGGVLPTLVVLASDHGMTPTGQHGGASNDEVRALLSFSGGPIARGPAANGVSDDNIGDDDVSDDQSNVDTVLQVDLAPTLALLLGEPLPASSAGTPLRRLLRRVYRTADGGDVDAGRYLLALRLSADQLWGRLNRRFSPTDRDVLALGRRWHEAAQRHAAWARGTVGDSDGASGATDRSRDDLVPCDPAAAGMLPINVALHSHQRAMRVADEYHALLDSMQRRLLSSDDAYDVPRLLAAVALSASVAVGASVVVSVEWRRGAAAAAAVDAAAVGANTAGTPPVAPPPPSRSAAPSTTLAALVLFAAAIHPLAMSSSSAVENEHALVMFFASTGLALLAFGRWVAGAAASSEGRGLLHRTWQGPGAAVATLACLRALRSGNQVINWAALNGLDTSNGGVAAVPDTSGLASVCAARDADGNEASAVRSAAGSVVVTLVRPIVATAFSAGAARDEHLLWLAACAIVTAAVFVCLCTWQLRSSYRAHGGSMREHIARALDVLGAVSACVAAAAVVSHHGMSAAAVAESDAAAAPDTEPAPIVHVGSARTAYGAIAATVACLALAARLAPRARGSASRLFSAAQSVCVAMLGLLLVMLPCRAPTLLLCGAAAMAPVALFTPRNATAADATQGALSQWFTVVLSHWLGLAGFFALGNSHLVTTLQFEGAYAGLEQYSVAWVAVVSFALCFAGPSLSTLALLAGAADAHQRMTRALAVFALACWGWAGYSAVVVALRYHLMVWTVFAPKLLYAFGIAAWGGVVAVGAALPHFGLSIYK